MMVRASSRAYGSSSISTRSLNVPARIRRRCTRRSAGRTGLVATASHLMLIGKAAAAAAEELGVLQLPDHALRPGGYRPAEHLVPALRAVGVKRARVNPPPPAAAAAARSGHPPSAGREGERFAGLRGGECRPHLRGIEGGQPARPGSAPACWIMAAEPRSHWPRQGGGRRTRARPRPVREQCGTGRRTTPPPYAPAGGMVSRAQTWSSAPGLIQPIRSCTACSTGSSRVRRARAVWPPYATCPSAAVRCPPSQPDSGGHEHRGDGLPAPRRLLAPRPRAAGPLGLHFRALALVGARGGGG